MTISLQIGPYTFARPWLLAPMSGFGDLPFRRLARKMGAGAAPTELLSAKGLALRQKKTLDYLRYDPEFEEPFWVQIFGSEPEVMAAAAEVAVAAGAKLIDINMGCPVKKVLKTGAGGALLGEPLKACKIVEAVRRATNVPVTVKMRAGLNLASLNFLELGRSLAAAGCAAITLHARTVAQGYSGQANWSWIKELALQLDIPLIGNGDVHTALDALELQRQTQVSGVMIGRAALGYPWIFQELSAGDLATVKPPTTGERFKVLKEHLLDEIAYLGHELTALRRFRPHLLSYSRGLRGGAEFRNLVKDIDSLPELLRHCQDFFREDI